MKRSFAIVSVVALLCGRLLAGQSGEKLQFEVLSVKPVPQWDHKSMPPIPKKEGGPGTSKIAFHNYPLRDLLLQAYDVQPYQISGPSWVVDVVYADKDMFDLSATMPAETTKEQFATMLQNALVERFNMKIHRENTTAQGYALTIGKQPKLARSPEFAGSVEADAGFRIYPLGKDDFEMYPPGYSGLSIKIQSDRHRIKFMRQSMAQFAKWAGATQLKRPVIDRTGLEGSYDFILEFEWGGPKTADPADGSPAAAAPSFLNAVESVLGLKLVREMCPIEMLVIDHVDRVPTAN
jgi:uncharacterized protein (TIGR03435 family)